MKRQRATCKGILKLIKNNANVEVLIALNPIVFSRHYLSYEKGLVRDESGVDGKVFHYPEKKFTTSFIGEMCSQGRVFIEEIVYYN